MSGDFLSRWSRRKRDVAAVEQAPEPGEAVVATETVDANPEVDADLAEAIAALPPIETLTSETDLTQFLRAGIPSVLRNAALRRMWSLDPSIRDYVSEAREYAYDWNVVGGVPGQGPLLPSDDVESMLRQVFGGTDPVVVEEDVAEAAPPVDDLAEVAAEGITPPKDPADRQTDEAAPLAPPPEGDLDALSEVESPRLTQSLDPAEVSKHEAAPLRLRRHGGASPI